MTVPAHGVSRTLHETIWYGEHDHRTASAEYRRTHKHLIDVLDEPCWVCGVRKSTLGDPSKNLHGASQLETHHAVLEQALASAVDPAKILADFPAMGAADEPHLRAWLDSEGNMLVLCDVHHRHGFYGVHMVSYPAWVVQRHEWDGWDLKDGPKA